MAIKIVIISLLMTSARCSTHWVVTEEGKVQEQLESPFAINQPHDLVAFMKQEKNYDQMQVMKEMLIKEKQTIEENEDKEVDLEVKHYRQDNDCKLAGKPLSDFDLYISSLLPLENKEIQVSDYIDTTTPTKGTVLVEPDCGKMYDLPYSVHSYDHLEGVKNRKHLHYLPETGLRTTLKYMETEEALANAIASALHKNSSSWVAYDLATFYWRMKGNAECAVECARRALHFSPTEYKDVALVNLANILHRSHYSQNASIIMLHALEISTQFNVNHFTLASIYAALSEYNKSIEYFEKTVEDQPNFEAAKKRLLAVKCQHKLQIKLEAQHESLQRTLRELEAYQEKHKKYMDLYMTIERMQLSRQEQINMHFLLMQYLIKQGTFDHKLCKFRSNESGPVMFCNLPSPATDYQDEDASLIPGMDKRGHTVNAKATTYSSGAESGTFEPKGDASKVEYNNWRNPDWPTEEHCAEYAPRTLAWDEYPSSYINPEIRGFSVRSLLTSYIGVSEGENLPQPWTELNCEALEPVTIKTTMDRVSGVIDRHSAPMHKQDNYVKREMLMHVNEGHVWPGDLGHRLHMALTKSLKDRDKDNNLWLLYNYAGLYFRVQGDNLKAVECIRRAGRSTPAEHYDVPLVNMANIMYRLGKVNDALALLIEALGTNNTEPVTYLAMGNALQAKGNVSGAITFYKYGLMLHPQYWETFHALMNVKCAAEREKAIQEEWDRLKHATCQSKDAACNVDEPVSDVAPIEATETVGSSFGSGVFNPEDVMWYTVTAYTEDEQGHRTKVDWENASNEHDLMRRLESKKEDADKILQDADGVIQRLSHIAKDNTEELNVRVSSARQIMQQLAQMRDSLGSLVQEASSTLEGASNPPKNLFKERYSDSECATALHTVDLRSYISSNMDVRVRGYNFGEELPDAANSAYENVEPICTVPSLQTRYNIDHLDSVRKQELLSNYDAEYGMEMLLKQLLPTDSEKKDVNFKSLLRRLSEGMKQNPISWRLAFLSSLYWRLQGKAKEAIDCLRLALFYAPFEMRDVVLLGLANVFAQLAQWKDAIHVTEEAISLNSDYFIYHFTLANILAAMGDVQRSIPSFKRAVELQPRLEIAKKRLEAAVCEMQREGIH